MVDLELVREKFSNKAYVSSNDQELLQPGEAQNGILMGVFSEYLDCITLNTDKLDVMLKADIAAWENNLELSKTHAEQVRLQIEELMKE